MANPYGTGFNRSKSRWLRHSLWGKPVHKHTLPTECGWEFDRLGRNGLGVYKRETYELHTQEEPDTWVVIDLTTWDTASQTYAATRYTGYTVEDVTSDLFSNAPDEITMADYYGVSPR